MAIINQSSQHPEIKAHNEHAARTNDPMIPKSRDLLQKGKTILQGIMKKPKKVTFSDLKKDPIQSVKTLVKNLPNTLTLPWQ